MNSTFFQQFKKKCDQKIGGYFVFFIISLWRNQKFPITINISWSQLFVTLCTRLIRPLRGLQARHHCATDVYQQRTNVRPFTTYAYRAPSEPLNYQVECSVANCMTAISGVTHFPMDWGSACQDLSEKVQHAMVACLCVLFAVTKFVALLYDKLA